MEYTERQLEEAKEYLRRRIESEISMQEDVERLLVEYAPLIVAAMISSGDYSYETNSDVQLLVDDLISRLLEDCRILAVDTRTDKRQEIVAYMDSERGGSTLEVRINERCITFSKEVAAIASCGFALKYGRDAIVDAIKKNLKHPWDNSILEEARKLSEQGKITIPVDIDKPSYGKGSEISSMGALQTMTGYAVADAWMWSLFQENKGAKGYYVFRGSSYPCDECDEAVLTGFHPMSDWEHFVPLHPHCKCGVIFV